MVLQDKNPKVKVARPAVLSIEERRAFDLGLTDPFGGSSDDDNEEDEGGWMDDGNTSVGPSSSHKPQKGSTALGGFPCAVGPHKRRNVARWTRQ